MSLWVLYVIKRQGDEILPVGMTTVPNDPNNNPKAGKEEFLKMVGHDYCREPIGISEVGWTGPWNWCCVAGQWTYLGKIDPSPVLWNLNYPTHKGWGFLTF
jgi:hypothetical protein